MRLLLEILGNMCIVMIRYPVCDVINFEINHNFVIKPFFYIMKKSEQKCKYLKNGRTFNMKQKAFFVILKRLSIARNCLEPGSWPLSIYIDLVILN